MRRKRILMFGIFLICTIFLAGNIFAYMSSKVQGININFAGNLSNSVCQEGQDLIVQLAPFSCTPAVVRTDLLEENNVPVFCQLSATQINPLVDIESIESISFSGDYSKEISGIGFHPAKAALGVKGNLNVPSLDNIGYIVVNIKKQSNVSAVPDYVSGTLTAKIKYNINEAFGIGNAVFYLPELTDEDWEVKQSQYGFWNGKGSLRAEDITNDGATISLYSNDRVLSSVSLEKGKTSDSIFLPGFECKTGLKLRLDSLENPDTRAQLRINSDVVELAKGEKFLDNKCQITSLTDLGSIQKVGVQCKTDSGTKNFVLSINPQLVLNIGGQEKKVSVGQWLYDAGGKSVYLGYVGAKRVSTNENDLFIMLVSMPQKKNNLTAEELSSFSSLAKGLVSEGKTTIGIIDSATNLLNSLGTSSNMFSRAIVKGQNFYSINFADKSESFLGQTVSIVGFAGAQDAEIRPDIMEYYDDAKKNYEMIIDGYSTYPYDSTTTYGEEALRREILLAWTANQKKTAVELCKQFEESYPDSTVKIPECTSAIKLANYDADAVYVSINKETKQISFDGINEPTFEQFGARVIMTTPKGDKPFDLRKDDIQYLEDSGGNYIQLISLDDESATVKISITSGNSKTQTVKLTPDVTNDFVAGYSFTLSDINLKKVAKVSVIPNIKNAGTETNFSFKIGIEKRAFQLSPEKTKSMVDALNKTITQWQQISNGVGTVVEGLKTACFATGIALVAKNLALGTGGVGIARQKVMRGSSGWNEKCASMVAAKTYNSLDDCFVQNADQIDKDVETLGGIIDTQNSKIKTLQQQYTKQGLLTEQVVDTNQFMGVYSSQVNGYLQNNNIDSALTDPSGKGETLSKDKILEILTAQGYNDRIYTTEQLREIELYTMVLNDPTASNDLKDLARQTLYSDFYDIQTNNKDYLEIQKLATTLGVASSKVGFIEAAEKTKAIEYTGLTLGSVGKQIGGYSPDTPVYVAVSSDGYKYLFILDNTGTANLPIKREDNVPQIYYYDTGTIVRDPSVSLTNIYFKKFDSTSYKNEYKNSEIKYYETDPYKGLPAIVPFDLANGWYAATKPTLATGGNIAAYDASARVSSFYLCNVGSNGLEENVGGDDICEMINTGTGQAYNQFPGLSESEAKSKISDAVKAIEQAKTSGSSSSGKVNILGNLVKVGSPAVDTPTFQCQDFMSPKECLLIFNLCDPVICPSSRCDLGGSYPVKDVVQTGIIGSIALCLPNFQEGIIMPVCLTGVKAGIDGLLSVQKSYRDCLQESVNTGKMVGICDEVYSVYLCDFVWKQAIPFADMILPKIMEMVAGQNVRGGGEYMGISTAWDNTENAVNYFTNYYGANAKTAFNLRTADGIQSEICKVYTSSVVPSGADILSSLTAADSPVQFTGRFDEIPFSTVTVPPTSHYKVYYHIYAGKDSGAYYQVYLKGSSTSTYYKDTQQNLMIASGYVAVDDYASETVDKLASSGYNELCINVNGQEECGFKQVSTDFAINYIKDAYIESESTKTDIVTTSECVSGSANIYSVLNPNIQSGAESLIDPEIYNQGIIRICATANPGEGTDPYAGTENSRWMEVGYCDDKNLKCWIDTDSVKETIKTTTVEGNALEEISNNYVDFLSNESDYLSNDQVAAKVQNITNEKDAGNRIRMINEIINKIFFSNDKVQLIYLRGNAYAELFQILFGQGIKEETITVSTETGGVVNETEANKEILELNDARQRVLAAAEALNGAIVPGRGLDIKSGLGSNPANYNCLSSSYYVYQYANVLYSCVYSDKYGEKYTLKLSQAMQSTIRRGAITNLREYSVAKASTTETRTISIGVDKRPDKDHATWIPNSRCNQVPKEQKLEELQPGDFILYVWSATIPSSPGFSSRTEDYDHAAIFIRWIDKANGIAELFDWNGAMYKNGWGISLGEKDSNGKVCTTADEYYNHEKRATKFCAVYRYYQVDLSDNAHPIYLYQVPYLSGQTTAGDKSGTDTTIVTKDPPTNLFDSGYDPIKNVQTTLGDKVYSEAQKIISENYVSSAEFVSRSMINAGITTLGIRSVITLIDGFEKQSTEFKELDLSYLKAGDIVLLGKGCNIFDSVGIFAGWDIASKSVSFYTYENGKVVLKKESTSKIFGLSDNFYIYRAYRYVGDLTTEEKNAIISPRIKWTKQMALDKISSTPLKGNYNDNKIFVDQLIMDGLLEEKECNDIGRNNIFGLGQKDIKWVESVLKNLPEMTTPWIEYILKKVNTMTTEA